MPTLRKSNGVARSTIYKHLKEQGLDSARKKWSVLTDDEIDDVVSEISLAHPFVGSTIVLGHLEARGIHLPRPEFKRVSGVLTESMLAPPPTVLYDSHLSMHPGFVLPRRVLAAVLPVSRPRPKFAQPGTATSVILIRDYFAWRRLRLDEPTCY
ncbi:hypothetical protein B0H13DRAFT_2374805 [Mycena leptocephala]|nr:hypothetical protein B0H13DRAFT_2374805 [Mycena leptocephala]